MTALKSWYLPESVQDAIDAVEDTAAIITFLNRTFTLIPPDESPLKTQDEQFGHYLIMSLLAETLTRTLDVLAKERP